MPALTGSHKKIGCNATDKCHCFIPMNNSTEKPKKHLLRDELVPRQGENLSKRIGSYFFKEHLLHADSRERVTGSIAQLVRALVDADRNEPQTLTKEVDKRADRPESDDTRTARVVMRMSEDQVNWIKERTHALRLSESRYFQILMEMDADYDVIGTMQAAV